MNRVYRLVWSQVSNTWIAVSENARGRGKSTAGPRLIAAALALASVSWGMPSARAASAANATVSAGSGHISTAGNTTTINQASQRLAIDWTSLSTRANEALVFSQPNAQAIALNRITGSSPSELLGSLTANGQVFILNPNGVLFGAGSQVNVGGLAASTLSMNNADFMAGGSTFTKDPTASGSVVNQGRITVADGGYAALISGTVHNEGAITTPLGTTLLAAGDKLTLNLNNGSLIGYSIDQGALHALAENKQLIRADGGQVLMSAKALDQLSTAVINNTGVIEARTVQNKAGRILLIGDMETGTVNVGSTLDASAPNGGDGGFIETSAARVQIADTATVTTRAAHGKTGTWLIDPTDFTIADSGGDITVANLQTQLASSNVTIRTSDTGAGNGDVFVNDVVAWSSANSLTLQAHRNIDINASVTNTGGASLVLRADVDNDSVGTVNFGAAGSISMTGGGRADLYYNPTSYATPTNYAANITGPYTAWMLVHNVTQLQDLNTNLSGSYALSQNIDALDTVNWNSGAGFNAIGDFANKFTGIFDGLGHTINDLTINRSTQDHVGLFGATGSGSIVRNVGMVGGSALGRQRVGGLVGYNDGGSISHAYATGNVTGTNFVGGLVGLNALGTISDAHAMGNVNGIGNYSSHVAGLVGENRGTISNVYATGSATGNSYIAGLVGHNSITGTISHAYATGNATGGTGWYVGGLVAYNNGGAISHAYATGNVRGNVNLNLNNYIGGLVGINSGTISHAYATGSVNGRLNIGGLVGSNLGTVTEAYATSNVSGYASVGGLVGTIGGGTINTVYATGNVSGSSSIGGLVGRSFGGTVSQAYAIGNVNGTTHIGGLVGNIGNVGTISHAYAIGSVTGTINVGGLIGTKSGAGTVSDAYWNITTSGHPTGVGNGATTGTTGQTTAQMQQQASFTGFDFRNDNTGWFIYDGHTTPLLNAFLTPLTITADSHVQTYNGVSPTLALSNAVYSIPGADVSGALFGMGSPYGNAINAGSYAPQLWSHQQGYRITWSGGSLQITPRTVTITGVTAQNKTYDGSIAATLTAAGSLSGMVHGETLTLDSDNLTAEFNDKNVGTGKTVTVDGYAINSGTGLASNYVLASTTATTTANITPKTVTVTGVAADNKTYNGTTAATVANAGTLTGLIGSETLTLDATALYAIFDDKNAGTGKTVTISGYALGDGSNGGLAGNYVLASSSGTTTAEITAATLAVSGTTAANKTYDGTTAASLSGGTLSGVVSGDTVALGQSGSFSDKNAATGKTVSYTSSLSGSDAGNYVLTSSSGTTTADITPASLIVAANSADKFYDGVAYANNNGATISGLVNGETVADLAGSLGYGGSSQGAIGIGNYVITPGGLSSPNYQMDFVDGVLTIKPLSQTSAALGGTALEPAYDSARQTVAGNPNASTLTYRPGNLSGQDAKAPETFPLGAGSNSVGSEDITPRLRLAGCGMSMSSESDCQ